MTKNSIKNELSYPVMEHFATIQGEGVYSGTPSYFVRLGGCDVGCVWCDVKESWPMNAHPKITVKALVEFVIKSGLKTAVITGGEPTMHKLDDLTAALKEETIRTHIETSGTNTLTGKWDWITFSPKKFKAPINGFGKLASELKVVVFNKSDFEFAEHHAKTVGSDCQLYLQPEWDKREEMTALIIDYVLRNPKWKISIQSHKYLNIP